MMTRTVNVMFYSAVVSSGLYLFLGCCDRIVLILSSANLVSITIFSGG